MDRKAEGSVVLSHNDFVKVERCSCRSYHLTFRNMMLSFNRREFVALVSLFKQASEKEEEDYLFSYVNRETC